VTAVPVPRKDKDPHNPEFPPHSPRFPATNEITIADFHRCKLVIKDESQNPTGSHKDRWAWEKFLQYRKLIESELKRYPSGEHQFALPTLSMISAGSAAYALQTLLRLYGLPPLKVLMDSDDLRVSAQVVEKLKAVGALIYRADLDKDYLDSSKVLELTKNIHGTDVTSRQMDMPLNENFYDWLVCEIVNLEPKFIFVPVGSGDLYANIITMIELFHSQARLDERITVPKKSLKGIHILGARPSDSSTDMNKLWAQHAPLHAEIEKKLRDLKSTEVIGSHSGLYEVEDFRAKEAMKYRQIGKFNGEASGLAGLGLFLAMQDQLPIGMEDTVVAVNTGWLNLG
jgi:Pyridoxal-phosphate dependent enzyme